MSEALQKFAKIQYPSTNEDGLPSSGLFGALLSRLDRGPACGDELGHARQSMASFQFVDGLLQVPSGFDAEDDAVVDQGERDGQALATTPGASEKVTSASTCKIADSSFGPADINFKVHKSSPFRKQVDKVSLNFVVNEGCATDFTIAFLFSVLFFAGTVLSAFRVSTGGAGIGTCGPSGHRL
jgi:hypothetical protein